MITSFSHKGLEKFYNTGTKSGIIPAHEKRLKTILQLLDVADSPEKLDLPSMGFHKLKGNLKNYYSVTVKANWRIIFQFNGETFILINYIDYH